MMLLVRDHITDSSWGLNDGGITQELGKFSLPLADFSKALILRRLDL